MRATERALAMILRKLANRIVFGYREQHVLPIQLAEVHLAQELRPGLRPLSSPLFPDLLGGDRFVTLEFKICSYDVAGGPLGACGIFLEGPLGSGWILTCRVRFSLFLPDPT